MTKFSQMCRCVSQHGPSPMVTTIVSWDWCRLPPHNQLREEENPCNCSLQKSHQNSFCILLQDAGQWRHITDDMVDKYFDGDIQWGHPVIITKLLWGNNNNDGRWGNNNDDGRSAFIDFIWSRLWNIRWCLGHTVISGKLSMCCLLHAEERSTQDILSCHWYFEMNQSFRAWPRMVPRNSIQIFKESRTTLQKPVKKNRMPYAFQNMQILTKAPNPSHRRHRLDMFFLRDFNASQASSWVGATGIFLLVMRTILCLATFSPLLF